MLYGLRGARCAHPVGVRCSVIGVFGFRSAGADGTAERAFGHSQGDVDYIIVRASAIRDSGKISSQYAEIILFCGRGWRGRGIKTQHFSGLHVDRLIQAFNSRQKCRDWITARCLRYLRSIAKQEIEQHRRGRIRNVGEKLRIILRPAAIELIFIRKTDDDLIHEGHAEP